MDIEDKIDKIILNILKYIMHHQFPRIQFQQGDRMRTIKYSLKYSREFAMIVCLLNKTHEMIVLNRKVTPRSMYYRIKGIFKKAENIRTVVFIVCSLLNIKPRDLGITSGSKGLIYGPIVFELKTGHSIDCLTYGGALIPPDTKHFVKVKTQSKYVLLVEKESVFRQFIFDKEDVERCNYVLITGKGYPDINTRCMVKFLNETLNLPVYALMDADPHGINIMLVYRFGTMINDNYDQTLATPGIRWIGLHPQDVRCFGIPTRQLSNKDKRKISVMLKKEFVKNNPLISEQLFILYEFGRQCGLEDADILCPSFLQITYVPLKLENNEFL